MGKKNTTDTIDKVNRTEENSLDNSTVELWLHKDYLDATIDDYVTIKGVLDGWQELAQSGKKDLEDSSDGDASQALTFAEDLHNCTEYAELKHKTVSATQTMRLASDMAKELLLLCESFYEILQGNEEYSGQILPTAGVSVYFSPNVATQKTPMCSELYLNKAYYGEGGGSLSTDTEDAVSNYKNISTQKDELVELLSHLKVRKLDISAECEAIEDDCKKRVRLTKLYKAFCDYVLGINNFNTTISDDFSKIIVTANAFDNTRTYEYPEIDPEEENMILNAVLMAELHEMGLTDEEIKNAINKSSLTLEELAARAEAIHAEDKLYHNGGTEILLFKSVLSGNAKQGYNKYADKLNGEGKACWIGVAAYIMGTSYIENSSAEESALKGNTEEYINQMNAILACDNPMDILDNIHDGAVEVTWSSNMAVAMNENGTPLHGVLLNDYHKNCVMTDMFGYLKKQYYIGCTRLGKEGIYEVYLDKPNYKITEASYFEGRGLTLTIDSIDKKGEHKPFEMSAQYIVGPLAAGNILDDGNMEELVEAAELEQKQLGNKMIRGGMVISGAYIGGKCGHPAVGAEVGALTYDTLFSVNEENISVDTFKPHGDRLAKKYIELGSLDTTGDTEKYVAISQEAFDAYKYFTYTGVEDALADQHDHLLTKMVGSVGACYVDYDLSDGQDAKVRFCALHNGMVAPEYMAAIDNPKGIATLGEWNEEFTTKMNDTIDAWADSKQIQNPDLCKAIISGEYNISSFKETETIKVNGVEKEVIKVNDNCLEETYGALNKVQEVYKTVCATDPDISPEPAAKADGTILELWGNQCE